MDLYDKEMEVLNKNLLKYFSSDILGCIHALVDLKCKQFSFKVQPGNQETSLKSNSSYVFKSPEGNQVKNPDLEITCHSSNYGLKTKSISTKRMSNETSARNTTKAKSSLSLNTSNYGSR